MGDRFRPEYATAYRQPGSSPGTWPCGPLHGMRRLSPRSGFTLRVRRGDPPRPARESPEAIRPTDMGRAPEDMRGVDRAAAALYTLVWRRAVASQRSPARFECVRVEVAPRDAGTTGVPVLEAVAECPVFDGHIRVWDGAPDGAGARPGGHCAGPRGAGPAPYHPPDALVRGGAGASPRRARHRPACLTTTIFAAQQI